jgi:hypothetical protein
MYFGMNTFDPLRNGNGFKKGRPRGGTLKKPSGRNYKKSTKIDRKFALLPMLRTNIGYLLEFFKLRKGQ